MPPTEDEHNVIQELTDDYWHNNRYLRVTVVATIILVVAGFIISIVLILQNQSNINNGISETKHQGVVNQKYLRCLVLVTRQPIFRDGTDAQLSKAIDDCAEKSRLP